MKKILVCVLLLAGCRDQPPPAPTAAQSDQLNEADSMLNDLANEAQSNSERQSNTAQ